MTDSHDRPALRAALLTGVWALPVFGGLLTLSTLTHQPSARTDFPAYAAYVTGPWFLPSHLVGSIVGAAFGIVGMLAAALVVVAHRRERTGRVLLGAVLLGRALATTSPSLRAAGTVYAVALPLFYVTGPVVGVLQPVFGAAFTAAAVVLARRLPAATAPVLPTGAGTARALV